jgi:hypothetical protein
MLITDSLTDHGREPGLGSSSTCKRATNTSLIAISFTIGESVSFRPKFTASRPAECHRGLHLSAGSYCSWLAGQLATNTSRLYGESTPQNACNFDAVPCLRSCNNPDAAGYCYVTAARVYIPLQEHRPHGSSAGLNGP